MSELTELRKFAREVWRRWWLVALLTLAGASISYWRTDQQERVYEATATVIVGQSLQSTDPDTQDLQTSNRLAFTYGMIVRRQPIMEGTVQALNLDMGWRQLRSRVTSYVIPESQLIEITVEAPSPNEARIIADQVALQLIRYSPTAVKDAEQRASQAFIQSRLEELEGKIETAQEEINELEVQLLEADSTTETTPIENEISTLQGLISGWEDTYSRLVGFVDTEESPNYVAVIEPAQASNDPVRPDLTMNTILGGAVGLIAALATVFALSYVDDTLKTEEDIQTELELVPLGSVTRMRSRNDTDKLITHQKAFSPASEAYRVIRSNIQFMAVDNPPKTILVTSAGSGEGKSLTAANLALVMAQAGLRTILVDADLRRSTLHRLFLLPNRMGLTDLLRESDSDISKYLKSTTIKDLHLLTGGHLPPNPSELLSSQRMGQVLERLADAADIVILDSTPALPIADAIVLSNRVDGVLLVVDSQRTRRAAARKALQKLRQADATVWGAVINRTSQRPRSYYAYEYLDPDELEQEGRRRRRGPVRRWLQRIAVRLFL
jgi:non-specific protein-tyrosine kinase